MPAFACVVAWRSRNARCTLSPALSLSNRMRTASTSRCTLTLSSACEKLQKSAVSSATAAERLCACTEASAGTPSTWSRRLRRACAENARFAASLTSANRSTLSCSSSSEPSISLASDDRRSPRSSKRCVLLTIICVSFGASALSFDTSRTSSFMAPSMTPTAPRRSCAVMDRNRGSGFVGTLRRLVFARKLLARLIAFELSIHGSAIEAEQLCSARLVALDQGKYAVDVTALELVHTDDLGHFVDCNHEAVRRVAPHVLRQIVDRDLIEAGEGYCSLHAIFQLAHVARPVVGEQLLGCAFG